MASAIVRQDKEASASPDRPTAHKQYTIADIPSFLTARLEEIRPYVRQNWREGIDFNGLYKDAKVLLLGDTDHRQHAMLGALVPEISAMRQAGVSDIALEISRGEKELRSLESFYETGDIENIRWIAENTRTPVRLIRFLKACREQRINVHFVDLPAKCYDPGWSTKDRDEQRGIYMGSKIAEIAYNCKGKEAAISGLGHLDDKEIPGQLVLQKVSYRKIGLVAAGQPSPLFYAHTFIGIGAADAVREKGLHDKLGTVYLDGDFGLDAFIHLPRVQLVGPEKSQPKIDGPQPVYAEGALVPLMQGAQLPALSSDMRDMIDPSCYTWEDTNAEKIFQFTDGLRGLSPGQQLYLGIMLENYVRMSMHNSGGSIVRMEYDPESRAFGVDTIDACGYNIPSGVDLGILQRHREVTLETLCSEFGFDELAVRNIEDLPKTDIRPNPEKPESAYKLLLLLSAYANDPARISCMQDGIMINDKDGSYPIAKLSLSEFALSEAEARLSAISEMIAKDAFSLVMDLQYAAADCQKEAPKCRLFYRRSLEKIQNLLMDMMYPELYAFGPDFRGRVFKARSRLEYLGRDSALELIGKSEKAFSEVLGKLEKIGRLSDYKVLQIREFRRQDHDYTFQGSLDASIKMWNGFLEEMAEIRGLVEK